MRAHPPSRRRQGTGLRPPVRTQRLCQTDWLLLGQPEKSLFHYLRALEVDTERLQKQKSPRAEMDSSYDNEGLARAYEALGKLDEALEQARITEKIRLRLASDDPNDQRPRLGLADIREVLGSILSRRGQKLVAQEYLEQAIEARVLERRRLLRERALSVVTHGSRKATIPDHGPKARRCPERPRRLGSRGYTADLARM